MRKQQVICPNCKNQFEEKPKRSFLGFSKFSCPKCNNEFIRPLTSGYRTTYYILLIIFIIITFMSLIGGGVAIPGLLTIIAVIALIKDRSLRKKISGDGKEKERP